MTMQAMVVLVVGYLSFGPALEQVAITRSTKPTYYPLEAAAVEQYDCYAGLPHGLGYLIGAEQLTHKLGAIVLLSEVY